MSDDTRVTAANELPPELDITVRDMTSAGKAGRQRRKSSKRAAPEPMPFRPMTDAEREAHEARQAKRAGTSPFGTATADIARREPVSNATANFERYDGSNRRPDQDKLSVAVKRARTMLTDARYDVVSGADKITPVAPNRKARRAHLQAPYQHGNKVEGLAQGRPNGPSQVAPWQQARPASAEQAARLNGASDMRGNTSPHVVSHRPMSRGARIDMTGHSDRAWAEHGIPAGGLRRVNSADAPPLAPVADTATVVASLARYPELDSREIAALLAENTDTHERRLAEVYARVCDECVWLTVQGTWKYQCPSHQH
jgi:hypothetical protein